MDLSNLNVLIFGISSDIGHTLANILNEYGANVIGTYNNHKIDCLYDIYKCDLKNEEDIKNVFNKVIDKHERIDVIVNMCAIYQDNYIKDKTKEEFMNVLEVNLVGTFLICKYASLYLERGIIINMSSTDATTTYNELNFDYGASKAGVESLTKGLSLALPNIKICALAPNWVNTKSTLEMDKNYLKDEMKRIHQDKLLTKEAVAFKIIEIILDDDIRSGMVIKMGDNNE